MAKPTDSVVVGLGQCAAGDDGVGRLVARRLRERGVTAYESSDAAVVLSLLREERRVVLVDAVASAGGAGRILEIAPTDLRRSALGISTHGLSITDAIDLARVLDGVDVARRIAIVGITIALPVQLGVALSPEVAAAIEPAADLATQLAQQSAPIAVERPR